MTEPRLLRELAVAVGQDNAYAGTVTHVQDLLDVELHAHVP